MFEEKCFDGNFYISSLNFSNGRLEIAIGNERIEGRFIFNFVQSYLLYKESNFWEKISTYKFLQQYFFVRDEPSLGIFEISENSIIQNMRVERFLEDKARFYWVSTPDECLEIVTFDPPEFISI
jgi:hypothetical protein